MSYYLSPPVEVALVGDPDSQSLREMLLILFEPYRPDVVVALQLAGLDSSDVIPLFKAKTQVRGRATTYVCRSFFCERPTTGPQSLRDSLDKASRDSS